MNLLYKICCIICLIPLSLGQETDEYHECQPIYTHNYGYKIFFHLPNSSILSNETIKFPFSVQSSSDAHILFSTSANPKDSDPVYEVVFGAGWNSYSEIRRLHLYPNRTSHMSRAILNKHLLKKFWVQIENGEISLGENTTSKPLVKWKDERPLKIRYISFSSWHGTNAKWYFDCWGATPVAQNKTISEKLRSDLFDKYNPYTVPGNVDEPTIIYSNISINYVNLDPGSSSMELIGMLETNWEDKSLQWIPTNYDNIESIRITDRKIWQPLVLLLNGATLHQKWFTQGIVTVSHEGLVDWSSSIHLITKCTMKMSDWPRDHHVCTVFLGLDSYQRSVHLDGLKDISLSSGSNAGIWEITSVEGDVEYMSTPWDSLDPNSTGTSVLTLEISLQRHSSTYYYTLYVPLKVAMIISVISFCLPYSCPQRIIIQVIVLIIFVVNLLSIDSVLPRDINKTPQILSLSSGVVLVSTVCTILTVLLIQSSRSPQPMSIPLIFNELINHLSTKFNLFSQRGTRNLLTVDHEEDDELAMKQKNTMTEKQTWQAFLTFVDYMLLFLVIIAYTILLLMYGEIV